MLVASLAPFLPGAGGCPGPALLVVDLDGDGLYLTDLGYPVVYDLEADGRADLTAWLAPGRDDGLLWLEQDGDGLPAAAELLRSPVAAWQAGGSPAVAALAVLDVAAEGVPAGAASSPDGRLTTADPGFAALGLWLDRNHDGVPSVAEAAPLAAWGIDEVPLGFEVRHRFDGNLNFHRFISVGGVGATVVEVSFRFLPDAAGPATGRYNDSRSGAGSCRPTTAAGTER